MDTLHQSLKHIDSLLGLQNKYLFFPNIYNARVSDVLEKTTAQKVKLKARAERLSIKKDNIFYKDQREEILLLAELIESFESFLLFTKDFIETIHQDVDVLINLQRYREAHEEQSRIINEQFETITLLRGVILNRNNKTTTI